MPLARDDLDSNLVSMEEEELLMLGDGGEPQLQALAAPNKTRSSVVNVEGDGGDAAG